MNAVDVQNRHHQAYVPGNHVVYSDLSTTILLDEELENYMYLHNWVRDFIDMDDWRKLVKDITLHVLSANKKILLLFKFFQAFPTAVSDISFDSGAMDSMQITYSATFSYQYFTFEKVRVS